MKTKSLSILDSYFAFIQRRRLSDYLLWHILLVLFFASGIWSLLIFNETYVTETPTQGGTLVEGIVGTPRFVNPVLAITRADHDLSALVYSGLMKINENGEFVNDVADSIELSEDGRTYHVRIKNGVRFHDGSELTARDVAFTIALIQNEDLKSPLRGNWENVIVEELGDKELNVILEEPYAPFTENFTVGILPRSIWDELPIEQLPFSQHNTEPIGSGPYRIADLLRNRSGLINAYRLEAFSDANEKPNIDTIVFNFYQDEAAVVEALNAGKIAGTPSLNLEQLREVDTDQYELIESPLPRTFAVYFNQNRSTALRDLAVRQALEAAIDRDALVSEVLGGHGVPIDSPVPFSFLQLESSGTTSIPELVTAEDILIDHRWTKTEAGTWQKEIDDEVVTLRVTLTTSNTPLFEKTAEFIAKSWQEIGVEVQVERFEQTDLVQGIIRPRDFEALLFGADVGRSVDLYPFWHSSQKDDPGLNIAQYTNITADGLLDDIRSSTDQTEKTRLASKLVDEIDTDVPAIFLFVPTFTYVIDKDIAVKPFAKLDKPSERFANVARWHINSSDLWPFFSNTEH